MKICLAGVGGELERGMRGVETGRRGGSETGRVTGGGGKQTSTTRVDASSRTSGVKERATQMTKISNSPCE